MREVEGLTFRRIADVIGTEGPVTTERARQIYGKGVRCRDICRETISGLKVDVAAGRIDDSLVAAAEQELALGRLASCVEMLRALVAR